MRLRVTDGYGPNFPRPREAERDMAIIEEHSALAPPLTTGKGVLTPSQALGVFR